VLKNSFQRILTTKLVRKLLNVRLPYTLKFTEITALVPFSTATPAYNSQGKLSIAMEQTWFEMAEIRKRRFDSAVWIPLRASEKIDTGKWGYLGFKSEFFGAGSLVIPLRKRCSRKAELDEQWPHARPLRLRRSRSLRRCRRV